jgi:thymidylate synthase (FAD)
MDKLFQVNVLAQTPNPQQTIYAALHQDYNSNYVWDEWQKEGFPSEEKCGEIAVKRLLEGDAGHWGAIEHPQIIFSTGYFPHSAMQQLRTHRNISFDVQSFRYTSDKVIAVAEDKLDVEKVFYLRPVGDYTDRQGAKYHYSSQWRENDLLARRMAAKEYKYNISQGMSEEHARGGLSFDYRQHFVVSCNARAFLHLADLRAKKNAQLECQQFIELCWPHFEKWCPAIADYYKKHRYGKARLAP